MMLHNTMQFKFEQSHDSNYLAMEEPGGTTHAREITGFIVHGVSICEVYLSQS